MKAAFVSDALWFYRGKDVTDLRQIFETEAYEYNEQGYDIFWCVNKFREDRRVKENLLEVRAIMADFDAQDFTKWKTEKGLFIPWPTHVVRTRSGFHAYWCLKEPQYIEPDLYKEFVEEALVPLGADNNAKDVCRILRPPGFRYWQDSKGNRYEEKEIWVEETQMPPGPSWEWKWLKSLFTAPSEPVVEVKQKSSKLVSVKMPNFPTPTNDTFWATANTLPVKESLEVLSGTSAVSMETYSFKKQGKINRGLS